MIFQGKSEILGASDGGGKWFVTDSCLVWCNFWSLLCRSQLSWLMKLPEIIYVTLNVSLEEGPVFRQIKGFRKPMPAFATFKSLQLKTFNMPRGASFRRCILTIPSQKTNPRVRLVTT